MARGSWAKAEGATGNSANVWVGFRDPANVPHPHEGRQTVSIKVVNCRLTVALAGTPC